MEGVTEYMDNDTVLVWNTLEQHLGYGRLVIKAYAGSGNDYVEIDLLQVLDWVKKHRPELLLKVLPQGPA